MHLPLPLLVVIGWAAAGIITLVVRVKSIGWFDLFYQDLKKRVDQGLDDQSVQEVYTTVSQAKAKALAADEQPSLQRAVGPSFMTMIVLFYALGHAVLGPVALFSLTSEPPKR